MKHYWIGKAAKEKLRSMGAINLCPTEFSRRGIVKTDVNRTIFDKSFVQEEYVFQANEGFELMCKIVIDRVPSEITKRQFDRIVSGRPVPTASLNIFGR